MTVTNHTTYDYHEIGTNPAIRHHFETHRKYLKEHPKTRIENVGDDARPFFYNLYGYLIHKRTNEKLHWLILMLSDIDSPEDFNENVKSLVIPDLGTVEEILQLSGL